MFYIVPLEVKSDSLSIFRRQFEYISIYMNLNNVQVLIKIIFCERQEPETQDCSENTQNDRSSVSSLGIFWKANKGKV